MKIAFMGRVATVIPISAVVLSLFCGVAFGNEDIDVGTTVLRSEVAPDFYEIVVVDHSGGPDKRMLEVRGQSIPVTFGDLYSINTGIVVGNSLFLLLRGNYGFFAVEVCKNGSLDMVAAFPELDLQSVWSFDIRRADNGSMTTVIEYGCPDQGCCGEPGCEVLRITRSSPYGGLYTCESALRPPAPEGSSD